MPGKSVSVYWLLLYQTSILILLYRQCLQTKKGNLSTLTDEQASVDMPKAGRGTASNNTIPQPAAESNTKYSMRERDDRQALIIQKNPAISTIAGFSLNGRSAEIWTPGLLVPNQARYQLRYTPIWCSLKKLFYYNDIMRECQAKN